MSKKILVLANHGLSVHNFRKEMFEELIEAGHEVHISLPYDKNLEYVISLGCKFIETQVVRRSTNPLTNLKLLLNYRRIVKKVKPDIVLTFTVKPNIYGGLVCRLLRVPYVANVTGLGTAVENGGVMKTFVMTLYKLAFKKARVVFFQNSHNMELFLEEKAVRGKTALLPGSGVNLDDFSALEYPEGDVVNFVFIGRLMRAKGIEEYFDAAEIIRAELENTRFHICGFAEEDYQERLKDLQERGIVQFHGNVDDMHAFLEDMHCIVQPSHHEGMSNTVLEAASSARPVIATNIPGCCEAVEDGVSGLLYTVKDTTDLTEKIRYFMSLGSEQRYKMGNAARAKMQAEFDRKIVTQAYLDEIQAILS